MLHQYRRTCVDVFVGDSGGQACRHGAKPMRVVPQHATALHAVFHDNCTHVVKERPVGHTSVMVCCAARTYIPCAVIGPRKHSVPSRGCALDLLHCAGGMLSKSMLIELHMMQVHSTTEGLVK